MEKEAEIPSEDAPEAERLGAENPSILLVTANVGSLFEDPTRLLHTWLKSFSKKVSELQPQFLALHLQEVGGKTYDKSMEYVEEFIRCLCESTEMGDFECIRIYMDEDYHSAEHFTALGNLYFVHRSLKDVKIWNFLTHIWEPADNKYIYSGNIETIATKEKSKFPQHFFPECKWSRKGFMRTRWDVEGTIMDLVNIHLFHDASNLAACEEFPSVYCKTRRKALVHTLERFHLDNKNGFVPYFVFGDFNFRCDTEGVIKELTENLTTHRVQGVKSDSTKVHYRNTLGDNVLTVGKKEFNHADHQLKFKEVWLKKFDRELEALKDILVEFPIEFPPSYPFEEDPEMPNDYMSTRCPSWCDRILMSPQAKEIISDGDLNPSYSIVGEDVCMGDHKPIYLNFRIKPNQGTYKCCHCYTQSSIISTSQSDHDTALADYFSPINCPYNSKMYKQILHDCQRKRENQIKISRMNETSVDNSMDIHEKFTLSPNPSTNLSQMRESSLVAHPLPISINIIDSDNLYVCMCTQMACDAKGDEVDGSICPECRKIIQRQPMEHRYRLISKRLMLSNNIIVNRINTQYLNAYFDPAKKRQDPYTPESAESHSPCPEFSSTSTTTSSNSQSPLEAFTKSTRDDSGPPLEQQRSNCKTEEQEAQKRGIVSPNQLKSRLEDLQRSSLKSLYKDGDCDVEHDVDRNCPDDAVCRRDHHSCFPECCKIH